MDASIIKQLIEMDRAARKIVEDAEEQKKEADRQITEEKSKVESEILERAKKRIEIMKSQNVDASGKETLSIEEEGRQNMQKLKESYDKRHESLEDELYERCIAAF